MSRREHAENHGPQHCNPFFDFLHEQRKKMPGGNAVEKMPWPHLELGGKAERLAAKMELLTAKKGRVKKGRSGCSFAFLFLPRYF